MRIRSLRDLSGPELRPLLLEETEYWAAQLMWDFSEVAWAVESGLDREVLAGRVLEDGGRPVAYCYYLLDGSRAIIGSLYAAQELRGQGIEEGLLDAVLAEAQADHANTRVECQTLFSTAADAEGRFAQAGFIGRARHYLVRDLDGPVEAPSHGFDLRPLRREDLQAAARVIHRSHEGSPDAALNSTYATPSSCRGFVETLVLRAGCGRFLPYASLLARAEGAAVGVIIASLLSSGNGHICQVSVLPEAQGRGLGAALVACILAEFRREGLSRASLSVTVGNQPAYGLYRRLGFEVHREFAAYAWVRPPARIELPA